MKIIILCFFVSISFVLTQSTFAGGLSTTFGEVLVENLPLGKDYSMKKEAKTPLIINNTSNQTVSLKLEVLSAQESELKEGFEPIPDTDWIKLIHTEFVLEPGKSANTDVIISIPDEQEYSGKKYQVYIWSHTVDRTIGVGLKSRLLFTIREQKEE